jgi:acetate kinase
MDAILVVNAGSSSLKFQVFATGASGDLDCLVKGQMDGIGTRPRLRAAGPDKKPLIDQSYPVEKVPDLPAATQETGDWLRKTQKVNLVAVGHRVVHGGPEYSRRPRERQMSWPNQRYVSLRAEHQPNNLAPIRTLFARRPESHRLRFRHRVPPRPRRLADHFAIPEKFTRRVRAMASTVFPMSTSPIVCVRSRPRLQRAA